MTCLSVTRSMNSVDRLIQVCQEELKFKTARSGGPGGQHVNKIESKVILNWDILASTNITEDERSILFNKLENVVSKAGVMVLYHQTERSQSLNKEFVIRKWRNLVRKALFIPKKRIATKPTKVSVAKTKKLKSQRSQVKKMRRKPTLDD